MLHAPLCHGLHLFLVFVYPIVTVFSSQVLDTSTGSCVASSALYTLTHFNLQKQGAEKPFTRSCGHPRITTSVYNASIVWCKSFGEGNRVIVDEGGSTRDNVREDFQEKGGE